MRDRRVSQFGPFSGKGLQLSASAQLHVARLHVARGSSRKMSAGRVMMGVGDGRRGSKMPFARIDVCVCVCVCVCMCVCVCVCVFVNMCVQS